MENVQSGAEQEREDARLSGEGWRWYKCLWGYLLLR